MSEIKYNDITRLNFGYLFEEDLISEIQELGVPKEFKEDSNYYRSRRLYKIDAFISFWSH